MALGRWMSAIWQQCTALLNLVTQMSFELPDWVTTLIRTRTHDLQSANEQIRDRVEWRASSHAVKDMLMNSPKLQQLPKSERILCSQHRALSCAWFHSSTLSVHCLTCKQKYNWKHLVTMSLIGRGQNVLLWWSNYLLIDTSGRRCLGCASSPPIRLGVMW